MKVKELIESLLELDIDADVLVQTESGYAYELTAPSKKKHWVDEEGSIYYEPPAKAVETPTVGFSYIIRTI